VIIQGSIFYFAIDQVTGIAESTESRSKTDIWTDGHLSPFSWGFEAESSCSPPVALRPHRVGHFDEARNICAGQETGKHTTTQILPSPIRSGTQTCLVKIRMNSCA
jgi:hypothetical protein